MTKAPGWLLLALVVLAGEVASTPVSLILPESTFSGNDMLASFTRMVQMSLPDEDSSSQIPKGNLEIRVSGFTGVVKAADEQVAEQPAQNDVRAKPVQVQETHDAADTSDYEVHGDSRYKFHSHGADWSTAKATCEQEDAHLVIINSEEEAQLLGDMFAKHPNPDAYYTDQIWIGVSDIEEEGRFLTVLGDELSTVGYASWFTNQPDDWKVTDSNGEDCVTMRRDKLLNDVHCSARMAFVCEVKRPERRPIRLRDLIFHTPR